MEKKKRRGKHFLRVLAVLLLLVAVLLVSLYLYEHEDDWLSSSQALRIAVHDAGTDEGLIYDVRNRTCRYMRFFLPTIRRNTAM